MQQELSSLWRSFLCDRSEITASICDAPGWRSSGYYCANLIPNEEQRSWMINVKVQKRFFKVPSNIIKLYTVTGRRNKRGGGWLWIYRKALVFFFFFAEPKSQSVSAFLWLLHANTCMFPSWGCWAGGCICCDGGCIWPCSGMCVWRVASSAWWEFPSGVGLVVTSDQSELEWGEEEDQGSGDSGEGVRYGCSFCGWAEWPGVVPSEPLGGLCWEGGVGYLSTGLWMGT